MSFQQAVTASPNDGLLRGNLGDALARLNRTEEARQAWLEAVRLDRQALAVNPNDATTLARIALREAKLGDRAAAERRHHAGAVAQCNRRGSALSFRGRARAERRRRAGTDILEQALKNGYSAAMARRDRDLDGIRRNRRGSVSWMASQ